MMTKKACAILVCILLVSVTLQADPFALKATHDAYVGNDPDVGPLEVRATSSSVTARDISLRRQATYLRYDLSQIKEDNSSLVFSNVRFNILYAQLSNFDVWGVKESLDDFSLHGTSYSTGPGLVWDITTPLDTTVVIDENEVSYLMTVNRTGFVVGTRKDTEGSQALDDFINESDDDGALVFFLTGGNAIIRSLEHTSTPYVYNGENLTGLVMLYDLTAPFKPTKPNPANNSIASSAIGEINWLNPDPNLPSGTITCDVYFGQGEPNMLLPGYGLPLIAQGISGSGISVSLQKDEIYLWTVICYDTTRDEPIAGSLWRFQTTNTPPDVDAGPNQYLWLGHAGDPETATAVLNGTVTDDAIESVQILWEQISGPEISVINPSNSIYATAVMPGTGTYQFRLTATDPDYVVSDSCSVFVGETACDAAKATPGYVGITADMNNDCKVDMTDLNILASQWMECNILMPITCF